MWIILRNFLFIFRTSEEYKDKIKTDTLQKLHTITNLRELLDAHHEGVAPTLRDDQLLDEAAVLRKKYLVKYSTAIEAAQVSAPLVFRSIH